MRMRMTLLVFFPRTSGFQKVTLIVTSSTSATSADASTAASPVPPFCRHVIGDENFRFRSSDDVVVADPGGFTTVVFQMGVVVLVVELVESFIGRAKAVLAGKLRFVIVCRLPVVVPVGERIILVALEKCKVKQID